jgi:hypothetical protein
LIQINTNGDLIYQRCLGGSDDEAGFTLNSWLEMTSDSTFNLVGSSSSTDGDLEGIHYPSSTVNSDIWIMKFKIITANSISGIIYHDNNTNCVQESIEDGISNVIMKTEPANFYGISDTSGKYHILTDIGSYQLKTNLSSNIKTIFTTNSLSNIRLPHGFLFSIRTRYYRNQFCK